MDCGESVSGLPDDVACNAPVSLWGEFVADCDGFPAHSNCICRSFGQIVASCDGHPDRSRCNCVMSTQMRVERVALSTASADADRIARWPGPSQQETADRLCVPIAGS